MPAQCWQITVVSAAFSKPRVGNMRIQLIPTRRHGPPTAAPTPDSVQRIVSPKCAPRRSRGIPIRCGAEAHYRDASALCASSLYQNIQ